MVAQLDQISTSDAVSSRGVGTAPGARAEAVSGFEPDSFKATKAAMTPNYDTGLHNVSFEGHPGSAPTTKPAGSPEVKTASAPEAPARQAAAVAGKTPSVEGQENEPAQPGIIEPKDQSQYKTPVIPPEVVAREPDNRPMDENGRRSGDSSRVPNPDLASNQVETKPGPDGKPQSIAATEDSGGGGETTTTFAFDDKGNVTSRTIDGPNGRDVVQLDSTGKPISRTLTPPASSPESAAINPNDKVTVQRDASGKPTSIVSEAGDTTTKLNLDANGQVTSRSTGTDDLDTETKFDSNGRATYDQVTHYDADDKKTTTSTATPDRTVDQTFDKDGNVTKTEQWGAQGDYHLATQTLKDGSTVELSQSDGVDRAIVDRPDGTRIDYKNDQLLQTTTTKITNPDGSSTSSEDTPHYLSSMKTDANGFWEMSVFSKDSGVATQFKGTPGQDPNQGEASSRMQTVPI